MPTVFRFGAYRFFFYSREGNEPAHIHIEAGDKTAKFWLKGAVVAHSDGFSPREVRTLRSIIAEHENAFLEAWHEHFKRQA